MPTLIYISGWKGSGRTSSSYKWLERYFTDLDCYAAGGQTDVDKMTADLRAIIDSYRAASGCDPILIGNSYGGFLASLLPQTTILINPALFPSESLPHITDLTADEIERFRQWEARRNTLNGNRVRDNIYSLCTEGDELIPDHRTEIVSSRPPIMIPAGRHRLTDQQRTQYLLPLIHTVLAAYNQQ